MEEHPCILDGVIGELESHLSVFDYYDFSENNDDENYLTYKIVKENKNLMPITAWMPHTNPILVLFHENLIS